MVSLISSLLKDSNDNDYQALSSLSSLLIVHALSQLVNKTCPSIIRSSIPTTAIKVNKEYLFIFEIIDLRSALSERMPESVSRWISFVSLSVV